MARRPQVLIVAHQAPCRLLRAYLLGLPLAPSLHDDGSSAGCAALADGATAADGSPCLLALSPLEREIRLTEAVVPLPDERAGARKAEVRALQL